MEERVKFLVMDVETTGLFDFKKPADAEGQPRLAHLCIIQLDEEHQETNTIDLYVRPDGWTMDEEVAEIHGLTQEFLEENGTPIADVLQAYDDLINCGYVIAAYNAQYDTKVMRGEMRRAGIPDRFEQTPNVCLMRASTNVVKIPGKRGYKFPKLIEACEFFGIELPEAHRANHDAQAAVGVLRALHERGELPEPKIHYARRKPSEMPEAQRANLTDVDIRFVKETEKAWLVSDGEKQVWVPKSMVDIEWKGSEQRFGTMTLHEDLAKEKGLV